MNRRLRIEWRAGYKVTGRLAVPTDPAGPAVLLAHGAGAGQDHPFVAGLRNRLAAAGHPVLTFDYPYLESGRKTPDRPPVLLECHRAALRRLAAYGWPVVLAGKSMGGRMASHLAAERPEIRGLVVYGYPLVAPSSGVLRDTSHLQAVRVPMLFVTGTRDRLAPADRLTAVTVGLPDAELRLVEEADHSFRVPKPAGLDAEAMLDRLAGIATGWIASALPGIRGDGSPPRPGVSG